MVRKQKKPSLMIDEPPGKTISTENSSKTFVEYAFPTTVFSTYVYDRNKGRRILSGQNQSMSGQVQLPRILPGTVLLRNIHYRNTL